ncbi:hypothetical protein BJX64DRAFT_207527 [Aspergillus heterothallicus]
MDTIKHMLRVTLFGSANAARAFNPATDIPSLAGKTILITGAAGDLGRQTAIELIRHGRPKRVYIADLPRSDEEKDALIQRIHLEACAGGDVSVSASASASLDVAGGVQGEQRESRTEIRFLELDLGSFESVRRCAESFLAREEYLDILILNAGVIRVAPGTTGEGFEVHFGVNYLGHALLGRLLAGVLVRTADRDGGSDVRVVVVSSEGYLFAPEGGVDFELVRTDCAGLSYSTRYGQSKVALLGLMKSLSTAYPGIKTVAIHPGRILTGMARSLQAESLLAWVTKPIAPLFCVDVSTGVRNHLWAATSGDVVSGTYYEPVGVVGKLEGVIVEDEGFVGRLKEWTDEALKGVVGI